jgi:ABC-2 type transport system ATP-binding protein
MNVVEVAGLVKSYATGFLHLKKRAILQDLSFQVTRGEVFGCLGPNGAGKTTTIKVMMGLVFADGGHVSMLGHPAGSPDWRSRVGFLPEHPYFYDYLTAAEYLDYVGRLFGLSAARRRERSRYLLDLVGLARHEDLALRRFSKGMVQRLGLAQALVNDPELVVLDEPMSGLDPLGRHLVRRLILDLKKAGKTIFFSTHILPDAESLCDRVILLRGGRVVEQGRLDAILRLDVEHMEVLVAGVTAEAIAAYKEDGRAEAMGERWRLQVPENKLGDAIVALERAGGRILSVLPVRQSLEEHFFKEMGQGQAGEWPA